MKEQKSARLHAKIAPPEGDEATGQAIWSGAISFSLVAIPVHLVKAVDPGRISFHMLHKKDYSPLLRRMVCPKEEKAVPPEEIVRGYEIGPDRYITVTGEELESLTPERSRTIEIMEFIDMKDVDGLYYDHPYYLVPSKGGEKAYRLLTEVMRRTNKAGLAKFVLREREYLVALKAAEGVLTLITLHYAADILPDEDVAPEDGPVETEDMDRMRKAIGEMTGAFNPEKYADQRRKKIMAILEEKARREPPVQAPGTAQEEGDRPIDLIAVLEESMRKVKKGR